MTTISQDDVSHLAALSSLQLTDGESEQLRQDLQRIISYINQLAELDTRSVEPTYQVTALENVWRADDVVADVARDQLLALAPEQQSDQVKVPQVL
mgnify:FL=1